MQLSPGCSWRSRSASPPRGSPPPASSRGALAPAAKIQGSRHSSANILAVQLALNFGCASVQKKNVWGICLVCLGGSFVVYFRVLWSRTRSPCFEVVSGFPPPTAPLDARPWPRTDGLGAAKPRNPTTMVWHMSMIGRREEHGWRQCSTHFH